MASGLRAVRALTVLLALATGIAITPAQGAESLDDSHTVGLGRLRASAKPGGLGTPAALPATPGRDQAITQRAIPSNQWYSSLLFGRWSDVIHAHPATYRTSADGLEIGYPVRSVVNAPGHGNDIAYAHRAALTLQATGFQPEASRLAGFGDFSAQVRMAAANGEALEATLVHGSPLSYYQISSGDLRVRLAAGARPCTTVTAANQLCVHVLERDFAVFAPQDAAWVDRDSSSPRLVFGKQARWFSVALLPDESAATLALFARHAGTFITATRVDWHYDAATSRVDTTFSVQTRRMPGADATDDRAADRPDSNTAGTTDGNQPLLGLYLHQVQALQENINTALRYDSVRGPIKVLAANRFTVRQTWQGILPWWGGLQDPEHREQLASVLGGDAARARNLYSNQLGRGTYWYGKALAAQAQLLCVAEQEGDLKLRDSLLASLKERLQTWFRGEGRDAYFVQDARLGTVVGYPDEYGSVAHLNDHHFHYGYWIQAAAQVALRDPLWASDAQWGGMVNLLVADIATSAHDRADFPFVRNFDPYEGHAWASGDATMYDGNNQESSSEAMNAWAGLVLWGEATHRPELRDLGIWLYTSEAAAIDQYWFDRNGTLFPEAYGHPVAAQVFGGRYAYNTWWTEEPRQIQGINLIPITPASLYLGKDPAYIQRFMAALVPARAYYAAHGTGDGTPADIWQDIFASFEALADPDAALAHWKSRGSNELGDTRSRTLFWLLSLKEMGIPDFTVHADTPLYGVFRTAAGQRTYLAYNSSSQAMSVRFSDGKVLQVAPNSLTRSH